MKFRTIKQISSGDCSLACLAMLLEYYTQKPLNYHHFVQANSYYEKLNLGQLTSLAKKHQLALTAFKVKGTDFLTYSFTNPIICQVKITNQEHFVVIYRKKSTKFLIGDPLKEQLIGISKQELQTQFCEIVMLSEPLPKVIPGLKLPRYGYFDQYFVVGLIIAIGISIFLLIGQILNQGFLKLFLDEGQLIHVTDNWVSILMGIAIVGGQNLILMTIQNYLTKYFGMKFYYRWYLLFINQLLHLKYQQFLQYHPGQGLLKYQYFQEIMMFYFPVLLQLLETGIIFLGTLGFFMIFYQKLIGLMIVILVGKSIINLGWVGKGTKINHYELGLHQQIKQTGGGFFNHYLDMKNRNREPIMSLKLTDHFGAQKAFANTKNHYEFGKKISQFLGTIISKIMMLYWLITAQITTISVGQIVLLIYLVQIVVDKSESLGNYGFFGHRIHHLKQELNPLFFHHQTTKFIEKIATKTRINQITFIKLNHHFGNEQGLGPKPITKTFQKHTFIFGKSGSGKTTLFQLIKNYYLPKQGKIIINDASITSSSNHTSYKNHIYLLTGTSPVYHSNIINNIFSTKTPFKSQGETGKKYHLDEFLSQVNLQYDEQISSNSFSRGQKQLLNGLELFFRKESLLLIDEGFNSLPTNIKEKLLITLIQYANNSHKLIVYNGHDQRLQKLFPEHGKITTDE